MPERTKMDILNAFNELLETHDFERLTIGDIIERARVSKATFYRHFKDKYDVMNYNYKLMLDHFADPKVSTSYEDLYYHLYEYGKNNWQFLNTAFETTGRNSLCDYIQSYSLSMVEMMTKLNRNGKGLTEEERLACDVYCIGISFMYRSWVRGKYQLDSKRAAHVLYEMMPETLRDYWWI